MAKQSGLGDNLYISGYDFSGDIGSLGRIGGGPAVQDVTGIDKGAFERIGLLQDGAIEYASWFNPSSGRSHDRLSTLPTTDQILTYCRGTTLGSPAAVLVAKQLNYDINRGQDGALTGAVTNQGSAGYPLRWGRLLTAGHRTDATATDGSSVDFGAAGTKGLHAVLHVFAFTGTDVTVKLQQSSDNGVGDTWADVTGATFASVTAGPQAQLMVTSDSQAVERYLRVVTTTTGGFTSLEFAVAVSRGVEVA